MTGQKSADSNDASTILEFPNDDDVATNDSNCPSISELIQASINRRQALHGIAAFGLFSIGGTWVTGVMPAASATTRLSFKEVPHRHEMGVRVADGYNADVLIRWGDKVIPTAPDFNVNEQTAEAQAQQFGNNNDFLAFMPLPLGSRNSDRGLLCVNHEFTVPSLMFPNYRREMTASERLPLIETEMAAHGHSIIEIAKVRGKWQVMQESSYNRRITMLQTEIAISGPAAGHNRLRTSTDPSGRKVIGTLNNCAGGVTPWGTVLTAEENVQGYFVGDPLKTPETRNLKRFGFGRPWFDWGKHVDRFHIEKEPHEANRFGWVVEIDPYDVNSTPVKRTALGRFKHECATCAVNPDGTLTVYSGDDQYFEYIYKFVTKGRFDAGNREANRDLLDKGTLFVARFDADGSMTWLPLVFGQGPLTEENDFHSQADVVIEARRAGQLMGATPMDRPEDVETNPNSGRVYVMLTGNKKRKEGNAANPRVANYHGHIIELVPPTSRGKADHAATRYGWSFFLMGGNPVDDQSGAKYHEGISDNGWLSTPDNCTFDNQGRIWISTDGQPKSGFSDSVYAAETSGPRRGLTRCFFNAPKQAEICGPVFTPDNKTLFLAIQHPGDDFRKPYTDRATRWPDFNEGLPPRSSIVVVTKNDGDVVGS